MSNKDNTSKTKKTFSSNISKKIRNDFTSIGLTQENKNNIREENTNQIQNNMQNNIIDNQVNIIFLILRQKK